MWGRLQTGCRRMYNSLSSVLLPLPLLCVINKRTMEGVKILGNVKKKAGYNKGARLKRHSLGQQQK